MYDEEKIVSRIEKRLQKYLGDSYNFRSERRVIRNTLFVDRKKINNCYPISLFSPFNLPAKIQDGGLKEIGSIHYRISSELTSIVILIDNYKPNEHNSNLNPNFSLELMMFGDNIISRVGRNYSLEEKSLELVFPNDTFTTKSSYFNSSEKIKPLVRN